MKALDKLAPVALAIVSIAITVGLGAIVLVQMQGSSYTTASITGEIDTPSEPLPSNYTLDASTNNDYVTAKNVEVTLEDGSSGTNTTLTEDTDYKVYSDAGTVELQSSPGGVTYNDSEDTLYTDYDYEQESQATSILGDGQNALSTFSDFFQVLVVVAIAAVIFLLLGALRRAGGRSMA